jgi:hypothetical protein
MSAFSCPHLDEEWDRCLRVESVCVPGRPGCVLRGNAVFLVPVEERLRQRDEEGPRLAETNIPASPVE